MNKNITATVLIVIAVGIYFTITSGMIDSAKSVRDINVQYQAAIENASQLIATRDQVTKKYNSISVEDRARLDKMIPSTVDNIRLIIDLNNLALRHGFNLTDLKASVPSSNNGASAARSQAQLQAAAQSPLNIVPGGLNLSAQQTVINDPVLDKVSIAFSVSTSYDNFMSFLRDIEADLRITDLTHLTLAVKEDGTYSFDVQLQTYWLRQ